MFCDREKGSRLRIRRIPNGDSKSMCSVFEKTIGALARAWIFEERIGALSFDL